MDRLDAIQQLRALQGMGDVEMAHGLADQVLCELLNSLGHGDVVQEWEQVEKWYA